MERAGPPRHLTTIVALTIEFALLAGAGAVAWRADRPARLAGPFYLAIDAAPPVPAEPAAGPAASTGSYTWSCRAGKIRNADNRIVSPGSPGAALHLHEYVGSLAVGASVTEEDLTVATTTCDNSDNSLYYWPVLRVTTGRNVGRARAPDSVTLVYTGSPAGPVLAVPRFLRALAGDARAATAGRKLARPTWTCGSATDRRTDRYPICPPGDRLLRVFDYPSCWDGRRTDSPDHRSHLIFPGSGGVCPRGTFAVPRLRITLAYRLPPGARFTVDTRPEQGGDPVTDHAELISVLPPALQAEMLACLNSGQVCGAGR